MVAVWCSWCGPTLRFAQCGSLRSPGWPATPGELSCAGCPFRARVPAGRAQIFVSLPVARTGTWPVSHAGRDASHRGPTRASLGLRPTGCLMFLRVTQCVVRGLRPMGAWRHRRAIRGAPAGLRPGARNAARHAEAIRQLAPTGPNTPPLPGYDRRNVFSRRSRDGPGRAPTRQPSPHIP